MSLFNMTLNGIEALVFSLSTPFFMSFPFMIILTIVLVIIAVIVTAIVVKKSVKSVSTTATPALPKPQKAQKEPELLAQQKTNKIQMLANISGGIREPLYNMMDANDQILGQDISDETKKLATTINKEGEKLVTLLNNLKDLSDLDAGKLLIMDKEYDMQELMLDLCNDLMVKAKQKSLEVNLDISRQIPSKMSGDVKRLGQIIHSLLDNALEHTTRGSITLSVLSVRTSEHEVLLTVKVQDTGCGVRAEDHEKIFEDFQQNTGNGTNENKLGLGLSISRKLLRLMNSDLMVESEVGQGAKFIFEVKQTVVDERPMGDITILPETEEEEKERLEKERLEKERLEKERLEKERLEKERLEKERLEKERLEKERLEKERLEKERLEKERLEKERLEKERLEKERLEKERLEKERLEKERLEKERLEKERLEKERLEKERLEKERLEKERLEKERLEKERLEKERLEKERLEKERLQAEAEGEEVFFDNFDVEVGMMLCGDDQNVFEGMMKRFVEEYKNHAAGLKKLYAKKDWAAYADCIYAMKNVSKSIGAEQIHQLVDQIGLAAKTADASDIAFVERHHEELMGLFKATAVEILNFFGKDPEREFAQIAADEEDAVPEAVQDTTEIFEGQPKENATEEEKKEPKSSVAPEVQNVETAEVEEVKEEIKEEAKEEEQEEIKEEVKEEVKEETKEETKEEAQEEIKEEPKEEEKPQEPNMVKKVRKDILLDEALGLEKCSGQKDLYDLMVQMYVDESKTKMKNIQNALDKKEYKACSTVSNTLKSTSRTIGLVKLGDIAEELEGLTNVERVRDVEPIVESKKNLDEAYDKSLLAINIFLGEAKETEIVQKSDGYIIELVETYEMVEKKKPVVKAEPKATDTKEEQPNPEAKTIADTPSKDSAKPKPAEKKTDTAESKKEPEVKREEQKRETVKEEPLVILDQKAGLDNSSGAQDLYELMLQMYLDESQSKIKKIKAAFDQQDWKTYAVNAANLKSTSTAIGAMAVGKTAEKLEAATKVERRHDVAFIEAQHAVMLEVYEQTIKEIKAVLGM